MAKLTELTDGQKYDVRLENLRIRLKSDAVKYLAGIDALVARAGGKAAVVALASSESKSDAVIAIAAAKTLIETISEDTDNGTILD